MRTILNERANDWSTFADRHSIWSSAALGVSVASLLAFLIVGLGVLFTR